MSQFTPTASYTALPEGVKRTQNQRLRLILLALLFGNALNTTVLLSLDLPTTMAGIIAAIMAVLSFVLAPLLARQIMKKQTPQLLIFEAQSVGWRYGETAGRRVTTQKLTKITEGPDKITVHTASKSIRVEIPRDHFDDDDFGAIRDRLAEWMPIVAG